MQSVSVSMWELKFTGCSYELSCVSGQNWVFAGSVFSNSTCM
jgi:hypothetical protein